MIEVRFTHLESEKARIGWDWFLFDKLVLAGMPVQLIRGYLITLRGQLFTISTHEGLLYRWVNVEPDSARHIVEEDYV